MMKEHLRKIKYNGKTFLLPYDWLGSLVLTSDISSFFYLNCRYSKDECLSCLVHSDIDYNTNPGRYVRVYESIKYELRKKKIENLLRIL